MKKIYYAHAISLYNTPQEARDIEMLQALGFDVINPNGPEHEEEYQKLGMRYFTNIVTACDAVAFRSFIDGKIGGGVGLEIQAAQDAGLPVIELPTLIPPRVLDKDMSRLYLKELGTR